MRPVQFCLICLLFALSCISPCPALSPNEYVSGDYQEGDFPLVLNSIPASLYVDPNEDPGILRAVNNLRDDLHRVTGNIPQIIHSKQINIKPIIYIGSLSKSPLIKTLIRQHSINAAQISGKRESFLIQSFRNEIGIGNTLILAGSDKRGTIYAIYDLCEQIGVSPWIWWADVPVQPRKNLFVKSGAYVQGPPAVRYRGIFLNDEAPALSGWVYKFYGNYNHEFYTKVFELILRLKGNFLWPAMWNNSFNTDDPLNPKLADEYGIVMGTSHHEPMMRAWKEWEWAGNKKGSWDYSKNADLLRPFWIEGIVRTRDYEKIITLGMRGDGDEPMSEQANITLLEQIVTDQRQIIADIMNTDPASVPQVWSLYKEVQGYYERGMRVPEDITLLWCDDNWGNLRRLPTPEERFRSGGAGIYYHFDYVGGPRSYRWINTNPIPKIWEQMNLAYHYDANEIWIVNVGDLKPMEFPTEFFLTLAWNPGAWPKEKLPAYTRLWAARQFGPELADPIAQIISGYTRLNGRRKPELMDTDIYSLIHYREAERLLSEARDLTAQAEQIYAQLPREAQDAFFQLVLHPVKATAIVNELYIIAAQNRLYAQQKRAATNDLAQKVRDLFKADADLSAYYNKELTGGKWDHMMDQVHIGYTTWKQPEENIIPQVKEIDQPGTADMGVAVEGTASVWPDESEPPLLPEFSVFTQDKHYLEIFNRGKKSFSFTAAASEPWILLDQTKGTVEKETRLWISIDWEKAPRDKATGSVTIKGTGKEVVVYLHSFFPAAPVRDQLDGFVESNGCVSIEAEHYTGKIDTNTARWEIIPEYGHTLSAMSIFPVTAPSAQSPKDSPCLEYKMFLFNSGQVEVHAVVAPTLNFVPGRGLRCAVSFDDQPPQAFHLVPEGYNADNGNTDWENSVRRNARIIKTTHTLSEAGYHTLRFWMVDPGVVLQKLVVNTGGMHPSYLGPPESYFNKPKTGGDATGSDGALYTRKYRNLFEEAGFAPQEIASKINSAFEQLFHGDPQNQSVYFPAGQNQNGPLAYICDINNDNVHSEGISYGMMIAVQMDKKAEFDALWNWAQTYMYHSDPKHPAFGYFSWSMNKDGTAKDQMPAPDGEEYFVTALYFADGRWGSGTDIYDYRAQADRLLTDMLHRQPITGPTVTGTKTGFELFDQKYKMVRFTPDSQHCDHTDPSYHLPAFYELWALWGPTADRPFWAQAAGASRDFFEKAAHPVTALAPDYANFDGSPWAAPWKPRSVDFQFDSWRTAMNWAFDWAWWAKDPRAVDRSNRIQAFFQSQGMDTYVGQYTLDGRPFGDSHPQGLVAANAVVSLAADHPRSQQFVRALWNLPIPSGRYRYYDGMLTMMALLHCSGNYRIWPPQSISQ